MMRASLPEWDYVSLNSVLCSSLSPQIAVMPSGWGGAEQPMCYGFPGPAPIPAVSAAPAREARVTALTYLDGAAPQHPSNTESSWKRVNSDWDQDASAVSASEV